MKVDPADVALSQRGDRPAQARLFAALIPTARFLARQLAYDEVDDAEQLAMLSIFDALNHYDARRGAFRPFAKIYMRRDIVHSKRKFRLDVSDAVVVDEAPLADDALNVPMTARAVRHSLRKLKPLDMKLVHGVMEGKSLAEVGRDMQVTRQAVHLRWQRVSVFVQKALVRHGVAA